ncbi:MAG: hypothetical protein QY323_03070 [Patescibacteria group bacterium]|nr:MAG: hypothetical protein QY323_03070 [Patescibacteria group bacterium]
MTFTKSWLGYALSPDLIEGHPAVKTLRSQGIEKRGEREYHLQVASFESVELEALNELVARTETETGVSLAEAVLAFDGYGILESTPGTYAYFSPSPGGARAAGDLKGRVVAAPFYDASKNCRDLHLTIGGVDPLALEKPKRGPLKQPFEAKGRLAFVGFDGAAWRHFFWNASKHAFVEDGAIPAEAPKAANEPPKPVVEEKKPVVEAPFLKAEEPKAVVETPTVRAEAPKPVAQETKPAAPAPAAASSIPIPEAPKVAGDSVKPAAEPAKPVVEEKKPEPKSVAAPATPKTVSEPTVIKTLLMPAKVMPDAACAVYLLRTHGAKLYPGVAEAEIVFGGEVPAGKTPDALLKEGVYLVERRGECASAVLSVRLGVADRPELRKLLAYAKRDFEKKGTLSTDPLDRAFGLTGVAMMMNRVYAEDTRAVLEFLVSVFEAHVFDESRRAA